jgi:hypothetical protein
MINKNTQDGAIRGWNFEQPRIPTPVSRGEAVDLILAAHAGELERYGELVDEVVSAIGHESTAALVTEGLKEAGMTFPANRITVKLDRGDLALIAQYEGPRLPEGAIELPEGASLSYWII